MKDLKCPGLLSSSEEFAEKKAEQTFSGMDLDSQQSETVMLLMKIAFCSGAMWQLDSDHRLIRESIKLLEANDTCHTK